MELTTALARTTDPQTSHDAAATVKVNELEQTFLNTLATTYPVGLTADGVAAITGLPLNSVSPRTRPLVKKGLLRDSGLKHPTRTGTKAIVWSLTSPGIVAASPLDLTKTEVA